VFSVGYYVSCPYDNSLSSFKSYRSDDCIAWFVDQFHDLPRRVKAIITTVIFMTDFTPEELEQFRSAANCYVCKKLFGPDIAYSRSNKQVDRHATDRTLADRARKSRIVTKDSTFGERATATAVWSAMKAKTKLGMGMTKKKMKKKVKKKVLPVVKRGGVSPLLPLLGIIGSLAG